MRSTEPLSQSAADRCAVTICRDHPEDAWRGRLYARVDGGAHHTFTRGHTITIALTPGSHALFAGESFLRRTVRFEVAAGEHPKFTLIGQPPLPGLGFLARLSFVPGSIRILRSTTR
jgi:hypothetical protein